MAKITKVINGNFLSGARIYTVPTGKVARIEILLGRGIKTSDDSINFYESGVGPYDPPVTSYQNPNTRPISNNYTIAFTFSVPATQYTPSQIITSVIVRNVTYLKAGATVQVPGGNYSILIVEEDAG